MNIFLLTVVLGILIYHEFFFYKNMNILNQNITKLLKLQNLFAVYQTGSSTKEDYTKQLTKIIQEEKIKNRE